MLGQKLFILQITIIKNMNNLLNTSSIIKENIILIPIIYRDIIIMINKK